MATGSATGWAFAAGWLLTAPAAWAQNAPPPTLRAGVLAVPHAIDGRLNEPAWAAADAIDSFTETDPVEGAPPSGRTVVRVLAGPKALVIGSVPLPRSGTRSTAPGAGWPVVTSPTRRRAFAGTKTFSSACGAWRRAATISVATPLRMASGSSTRTRTMCWRWRTGGFSNTRARAPARSPGSPESSRHAAAPLLARRSRRAVTDRLVDRAACRPEGETAAEPAIRFTRHGTGSVFAPAARHRRYAASNRVCLNLVRLVRYQAIMHGVRSDLPYPEGAFTAPIDLARWLWTR
jgi:hypothetical protein